VLIDAVHSVAHKIHLPHQFIRQREREIVVLQFVQGSKPRSPGRQATASKGAVLSKSRLIESADVMST
jgi:hypothetical protein